MSFDLGTDNPTDCKLWDLSGNYDVTFSIQGRNGLSVPVEISFALTQDPSGKISTPAGNVSGLVFNNDDNSSFAITTQITGKVTGSGGFARARFTIHFSGNGTFGGIQNVSVSGSMTVDAETDSEGGLLSGQIRNFTSNMGNGLNHISGKSDFAAGLPSDGTWNLTLNVAGLTKFSGTGSIAVSGQTLGLDLSGKLQNQLVKLNAKGAGDVLNTQPGQGSNAKIILTQSFDTLQLDGKLLGQKISLHVTTATD
jgi:hypothetical protein